jgi:hypothetical protein
MISRDTNGWKLVELAEIRYVEGGNGVKEGGCVAPNILDLILKTIGVPLGGRN